MSANKRALKQGGAPFLKAIPLSFNKPALLTNKPFWYALHFPFLNRHVHTHVDELASICQSVSDHVYLPGQDTLAIDIRGSLRLFGSPRGLSRTLRPKLEDKLRQLELAPLYTEAASPSASASVLLARTGHTVLIQQRDGLRSELGGLAIEFLAVDKAIKKRLASCGLHYLRDLWRLPSAALRLRFGRELSDYLSQLLGAINTSMPRWHEPLVFNRSISPDAHAETPSDILWLARQLLEQMVTFLHQHHKTTDHLHFELTDITLQTQIIELHTRKPVREAAVWLMLLELKLQKAVIARSIKSIHLICSNFLDYLPEGAHPSCKTVQLTDSDKTTPALLELLSARLGKEAIFSIHQQEDHDPVIAGHYQAYEHAYTFRSHAKSPRSRGFLPAGTQPCLLLPAPVPLAIRQQKPVYLSPLLLVRGPERLETRWWTGQDIQRDYYVARNMQGMRLWIFRDLKRSREPATAKSCWFLQGLFA